MFLLETLSHILIKSKPTDGDNSEMRKKTSGLTVKTLNSAQLTLICLLLCGVLYMQNRAPLFITTESKLGLGMLNGSV